MQMKIIYCVICLAIAVSVKAQNGQGERAQIAQAGQNQIAQSVTQYPDFEQYKADMEYYIHYAYLTSGYYPTMEEAYFWVKGRPLGTAKRMLTYWINKKKQKQSCDQLKGLAMLTGDESLRAIAMMQSCY